MKKYIYIILVLGLVFQNCNKKTEAISYGSGREIEASVSVPKSAEIFQEAFRAIAKKCIPTVVNISVDVTVTLRRSPFFDFFEEEDRFFRRFFDDEFYRKFFDLPKEYRERNLGTGFIVDDEGYILTAAHVIRNASKITVQLHDKTKYKGKIIGNDPKTDIAVIKIDSKQNLPVAVLGDSDKIEIGDWAIAIGNPFGNLPHTFTVGVISGKGRADIGVATYENFIQTDAALNPGNSGGPLLNIKGEVIGINSAIFSRYGGYMGVGFAIPINTAKNIFPQLKAKGKVTRGWLGVEIQEITEAIAKPLGIKEGEGVLVANVMENTPAAKAGLKPGDIIIEYDGKKVTGVKQLQNLVAETKAGKRVQIKVLRDKAKELIELEVGEMPPEDVEEEIKKQEMWLGMRVQNLSQRLKEQFGLESETSGVVVVDLEKNSLAASFGIQIGDLILKINREKIDNLEDYNKFVKKHKNEKSFLFQIKRKGKNVFIGITLE